MWGSIGVFLLLVAGSYGFYHKLQRAAEGTPERAPAERISQVSLSGN
jgi:hypothetical protein